ncbi:response regulator [Streptomyces sp. NPDC050658]|uniref:response regulator transcription factor n=1 Tax=unclassified Streptomyces TaxID=2593676 RepID=UPI003428D1A7
MLIADDQLAVRSELRRLVQTFSAFEVVAEAADGVEVLERTRMYRPHVVLMDMGMPRVDGVTTTTRLMRYADPPKVLVLTNSDVDSRMLDVLNAGASGVLHKGLSPQLLEAAMHTALAGGRVMTPGAWDRLLQCASTSVPGLDETARNRIARLSSSEHRVLELIGAGLSNAQIARRLYLSHTSVKTYVSRTLAKLNLSNRTQAAIFACEAGISTHHEAG